MGIFLSGVSMEDILVHRNIWKIVYTCIWLTIPANIFLYAINDAYDTETDANNPKKNGFELRSSTSDKEGLIKISVISILLCIPLLLALNTTANILVLLWVIMVTTYNIPPLRFKARPFLDNIFALNFPLWGVFGYYLVKNTLPPYFIIWILAIFAIVMHIYSASGDIEFDKNGGVITSAVYIGTIKRCLIVCILLTAVLIYVSFMAGFWQCSVVFSIYILFFMYQILSKTDHQIFYRYYIYLHYLVGFAYFCLIL